MMSRIIRLLIRRPAALRSPVSHLAVSLLGVAGGALLVWSGIIHLILWADGYKDIATIGPLFLAQGVGCIVLGLVVAVFRWLALLLAGGVTLAATAVGLLLSVHVGLLGYRESLAVPYAMLSLQVEFTGAAVLLVGAVLLAVLPSVRASEPGNDKTGKPGNPSRAPFRI
jgi:hypothetical protein